MVVETITMTIIDYHKRMAFQIYILFVDVLFLDIYSIDLVLLFALVCFSETDNFYIHHKIVIVRKRNTIF